MTQSPLPRPGHGTLLKIALAALALETIAGCLVYLSTRGEKGHPEPHQYALSHWESSLAVGVSLILLAAIALALVAARHMRQGERAAAERDAERTQTAEIRRLNRLLLTIGEVNKVLVRAKTREDLFESVCRTLVEVGEFPRAWIGLIDEMTQTLRLTAVAGCGSYPLSPDRVPLDASSQETLALREGRTFAVNDLSREDTSILTRGEALRLGIRSSASLPLKCEGRVCGLMVVYAVPADAFGDRELEFLEETAADVSYALDAFANDARRRTAESQGRARESRLNFLIGATPVVIYSRLCGDDFTFYFVSPNLRNLMGYDPKEAVGNPAFWRKHLHPDDQAGAERALAALRPGEVVSHEYRLRHADGRWRWIHDEVRLATREDGEPHLCVGSWVDVTDRREAEERLREREEIYSTIVDQAMDAIALVEPGTGTFVEFNRSAHEGLGYSREAFCGLRIVDIQASHSAETVARNIARARKEGGLAFESQHRHRDRSLRDVRVSIRPVRLRGRELLTSIWGDITEVKRAVRDFESQQRFMADLIEHNTL